VPDEERHRRKRRLLKGPNEFRDARSDVSKPINRTKKNPGKLNATLPGPLMSRVDRGAGEHDRATWVLQYMGSPQDQRQITSWPSSKMVKYPGKTAHSPKCLDTEFDLSQDAALSLDLACSIKRETNDADWLGAGGACLSSLMCGASCA
jgi:hypothetical protein